MSKPKKQPSQAPAPTCVSCLKKPLLVSFHACMTGVYGYAFLWQHLWHPVKTSVSLGKWKFMTFHCLCFQLTTYSLCLAGHAFPRLRKPRDFLLGSLAFPISAIVFSVFWAVYSIDRELILPVRLEIEGIFPVWLNHISHTIILPVNLLELALVKHEFGAQKWAFLALGGYTSLYSGVLLGHKHLFGRYVYPFMDHMSPVAIGVFIAAALAASCVMYKVGEFYSSLFHKPSAEKLTGGKRKKPIVKLKSS